jgi:hypothetical protein
MIKIACIIFHHSTPIDSEDEKYEKLEKAAKKLSAYVLLDSNGVEALAHFAEPVQQFPIIS